MKKIIKRFIQITSDDNFKFFLEKIEVLVSKILSLLMIIVIFLTIADLGLFIVRDLIFSSGEAFRKKIFQAFGLFLNVLIALELLENITAYLRKHVLQVELVIVTALIAIGRKIIILDLKTTEGIELIGLGISIISLAISYFVIR
ncbi:MAG: phosphate-starvation-inducible PsiE family protein, partial [Sphaerospermopsis sp. SIO1G2]|nr:phosphate-starvation-inducible PsiE family protein [Sphaerospermopsis sp. SIO1G2]